MKKITIVLMITLSVTAQAQQKKSTFNHTRDKGRKVVVDTTKNEVVNGKYKQVVTPLKDTVSSLQVVKSLVVLDVQEELKAIRDRQIKSGQYLIQAKHSRVQSLTWMASCAAIGSVAIALSSRTTFREGTNFGVFMFALGGTISIVKLIDAFNKIGLAGNALID